MKCFEDVCGTSVIYAFKIQLRNVLNLLRQVAQDFIVNCGSETFREQYINFTTLTGKDILNVSLNSVMAG